MRKFYYFVSYVGGNGFTGMSRYSCEKRIETFEDVDGMLEALKAEFGKEIVILNWKELKG